MNEEGKCDLRERIKAFAFAVPSMPSTTAPCATVMALARFTRFAWPVALINGAFVAWQRIGRQGHGLPQRKHALGVDLRGLRGRGRGPKVVIAPGASLTAARFAASVLPIRANSIGSAQVGPAIAALSP